MIHRVEVRPGDSSGLIKKEFRKKLMTGGAVLRLPTELSPTGLQQIFEEFSQGVEENGVNEAVLCELAAHPNLTPEMANDLSTLATAKIKQALAKARAI